MKVLVVSHLYPAPGYERHLFVHEQARALRDLGVGVSVVSPTPYAPRILWGDPRQKRRGQMARHAQRDGIAADYPRILQLPRRLLFERSGDFAYRALRRVPALRAAGIDLIHAHQALPDGAAAQRLAADLGVPYVVTVHGADAFIVLRRGGRAAARVRSVLSGAAQVMTVGSGVARLLADIVPPERLHVVLNGTIGVGEPAAPADYLAGVPLILMVGYLIKRKGHADVLEALAGLAGLASAEPDCAGPDSGCRDTHLAIVGEGALRADLARQAAALGLADRVHFLGRLQHTEVLSLMARADLFALPSWDEAFGLVYTEAMAQGTPVLACSGEGPEDFIRHGENGYLVAPRQPQAIAAVIATVLSDKEGARRVGACGRETAATLTWARNAAQQLAIYEQVLATSARKGTR